MYWMRLNSFCKIKQKQMQLTNRKNRMSNRILKIKKSTQTINPNKISQKNTKKLIRIKNKMNLILIRKIYKLKNSRQQMMIKIKLMTTKPMNSNKMIIEQRTKKSMISKQTINKLMTNKPVKNKKLNLN